MMSALTPYQHRADTLLRKALYSTPRTPLYGMLRYFAGFEDAYGGKKEKSAGKRIRSGMLLMASDMYGGSKSADDLAVAVELFHNFTLIHDDIEDKDTMRRGMPTVWKVWGENHAINAGDTQAFLTTRYLMRGARCSNDAYRAATLLNTYFLEVMEGQYLDFILTDASLFDANTVTREAYLDMIRKKTSVLIGAAMSAGGVSAGCDEETAHHLFAYGESLGMAYQIADDMASLWGDVTCTGKHAYGDILERKKTFPVLYARDVMHDLTLVREVYESKDEVCPEQARSLVQLLTDAGALDATRALGAQYVAQAKQEVQLLTCTPEAKEALITVVDSLIHFSPEQHATD